MSDDLLKIVGDYADQLLAADELAAHDSMTVAEALEDLYEARNWVAEFLEVKPKPQRTSNRWQEDSRHRFSQWVMWKLEQQGRPPLVNRHTYRLLDAARVASQIPNLTSGQIRTEGQIRPLNWLLKNHYADRIPDVWRIAVDLAGSADRVTSAHVRAALQQWKKDSLGAKGLRSTIKTSRAKTLRLKAIADIRALLAVGGPEAEAEYVQLLRDMKKMQDDIANRPKLEVVS
jgi:hypothetical protein